MDKLSGPAPGSAWATDPEDAGSATRAESLLSGHGIAHPAEANQAYSQDNNEQDTQSKSSGDGENRRTTVQYLQRPYSSHGHVGANRSVHGASLPVIPSSQSSNASRDVSSPTKAAEGSGETPKLVIDLDGDSKADNAAGTEEGNFWFQVKHKRWFQFFLRDMDEVKGFSETTGNPMLGIEENDWAQMFNSPLAQVFCRQKPNATKPGLIPAENHWTWWMQGTRPAHRQRLLATQLASLGTKGHPPGRQSSLGSRHGSEVGDKDPTLMSLSHSVSDDRSAHDDVQLSSQKGIFEEPSSDTSKLTLSTKPPTIVHAGPGQYDIEDGVGRYVPPVSVATHRPLSLTINLDPKKWEPATDKVFGEPWRTPKTVFQDGIETELTTICAAEHSFDDEGQGLTSLICRYVNEAKVPHMRWQHVKQRTFNLSLLETYVKTCPFTDSRHRLIALSLLRHEKEKIEQQQHLNQQSEKYRVFRCDGVTGSRYDPDWSVTFIALPYLLPRKREHDVKPGRRNDVMPRTLLQSAHGQVYGPQENTSKSNGVVGKGLSVSHVWCLLLGQDVMVTVGELTSSEIIGRQISLRETPGLNGPRMIRMSDPGGRFRLNGLYSTDFQPDFLSHVKSLTSSARPKDTSFDLVVNNECVLTATEWFELMKSPDMNEIQIKLVMSDDHAPYDRRLVLYPKARQPSGYSSDESHRIPIADPATRNSSFTYEQTFSETRKRVHSTRSTHDPTSGSQGSRTQTVQTGQRYTASTEPNLTYREVQN
ncbi:hypothetical protein JX266_005124 [Neoarthrinium moseri]|nr:hypothetical protein JX266_005124 [Neoarthrinium moseri]